MVNDKEGLSPFSSTSAEKQAPGLTQEAGPEPLVDFAPDSPAELELNNKGLPDTQSLEAPLAKPEEKEFQPPEKKSFAELVKLTKDPEAARKYFESVLAEEEHTGRISPAQEEIFKAELEYFEPKRAINDILIPTCINLGFGLGGVTHLIREYGLKLGLGIAGTVYGLMPIDLAGIIRSPYLIYRSAQELKKLSQHEGAKAAIKSIPFYTALNLANFVPHLGTGASFFLSFPRNKDVGLSLINNHVQKSRGPKFLKRFVNWTVQKLYEKPKPEKGKGTKKGPVLQPKPLAA